MKTLVLLCKDVIDHGHCSTSVWKTGDDRATLQLYLLESEGKPTAGDLLEVDVCTGQEETLPHAAVPTLFPPDHEPPPDTTMVHGDAPPVDNEHVAEGCEQFTDPTPNHEAVSSLDTPAQILGAAAEQPRSD